MILGIESCSFIIFVCDLKENHFHLFGVLYLLLNHFFHQRDKFYVFPHFLTSLLYSCPGPLEHSFFILGWLFLFRWLLISMTYIDESFLENVNLNTLTIGKAFRCFVLSVNFCWKWIFGNRSIIPLLSGAQRSSI